MTYVPNSDLILIFLMSQYVPDLRQRVCEAGASVGAQRVLRFWHRGTPCRSRHTPHRFLARLGIRVEPGLSGKGLGWCTVGAGSGVSASDEALFVIAVSLAVRPVPDPGVPDLPRTAVSQLSTGVVLRQIRWPHADTNPGDGLVPPKDAIAGCPGTCRSHACVNRGCPTSTVPLPDACGLYETEHPGRSDFCGSALRWRYRSASVQSVQAGGGASIGCRTFASH